MSEQAVSRTMTQTVETDATPNSILKILEDPKRIPEWAPVFADKVERDRANAYRVTKGEAVFPLEAVVERASRTVDYLRVSGSGEKTGAHIRVLPRPGGGSVVVMTLPLPPGGNADQVGAVLGQELHALTRLAVQKRA